MALNMNRQIEEYEKKRRRRGVWKKALGALGCLVVFCTIYALILPAITMTDKPDATADVETAEVWEATFADVVLSGNYAADLLQIAQTQLGYEESARNFVWRAGADSNGSADDGAISDGGTEALADETQTEYESSAEESADAEAADESSETYAALLESLNSLYETVQGYEAAYAGETDLTELVSLCADAYDEAAGLADEAQSLYDSGDLTKKEYNTLAGLAADVQTYVDELVDGLDLVKKGYTRYGAWYGSPYEDWCAMFVSFCLNYADVPADAFPQDAGCESWIETLSGSEYNLYQSAESGYVPSAGDLVFFDLDGDGEADHVGIVAGLSEDYYASFDESAMLALAGSTIEGLVNPASLINATAGMYDVDVDTSVEDDGRGVASLSVTALEEGEEPEYDYKTIVTIEGNSGDCVQTQAYSLDDTGILGYARMPEAETEESLTADDIVMEMADLYAEVQSTDADDAEAQSAAYSELCALADEAEELYESGGMDEDTYLAVASMGVEIASVLEDDYGLDTAAATADDADGESGGDDDENNENDEDSGATYNGSSNDYVDYSVADAATIEGWAALVSGSDSVNTTNVGRIWTDKSVYAEDTTLVTGDEVTLAASNSGRSEAGVANVNAAIAAGAATADDSDFLISLATLSSVQTVVTEGSYEYADIVLVLDTSSSMVQYTMPSTTTYTAVTGEYDTTATYYVRTSDVPTYTSVVYSNGSWQTAANNGSAYVNVYTEVDSGEVVTTGTYYVNVSGTMTQLTYGTYTTGGGPGATSYTGWYYGNNNNRTQVSTDDYTFYTAVSTAISDLTFYTAETTGGETRLVALEEAVNTFLAQIAAVNDQIAAAFGSDAELNKVSIITFDGTNDDRTSPNYRYYLSAVTSSNLEDVQDIVNNLDYGTGTRTDLGLSGAVAELETEAARTDAKNVVVLFTDGVPSTQGSTTFTYSYAQTAIRYANTLKNTYDATIYCVGVFDGADPGDVGYTSGTGTSETTDYTSAGNTMLNAISSNYLSASATYSNNNYSVDLGDGSTDNGYYVAAESSGELTNIFKSIASGITTGISYSTEVTTGLSADESGYIIFTDQLGDYMEFDRWKVIAYGLSDANDFNWSYTGETENEDGSVTYSYTFRDGVTDIDTDVTAITLEVTKHADLQTGDTVVVKVPASLIPTNQYTIYVANDGTMTMSVTYGRPLRIFYGVSVKNEALDYIQNGAIYSYDTELTDEDEGYDADLAALIDYINACYDSYGEIRFFSNYYSAEDEDGVTATIGATAEYTPDDDNSFYYFTENTLLYYEDSEGNLQVLTYAGRTEEELLAYLESEGITELYYYVTGYKMVDENGDDVQYDSSYVESGATSNTITGTAVAYTSDTMGTISLEAFTAKLAAQQIRATAAQKNVSGTVGDATYESMNGGTMVTGGTLTYKISVLNTTRSTADITITDYIPDYTTYVTGSVKLYDADGNEVTSGWSYQLYNSNGAELSAAGTDYSESDVAYIIWTYNGVEYDADAELSFYVTFDVTVNNIGTDNSSSLTPITNSASLSLAYSYTSTDEDGNETTNDAVYTPTTNEVTTYRTRAEEDVVAGEAADSTLGQYYVAAGSARVTFLSDLYTASSNETETSGTALDPQWNYDDEGNYIAPTDVTSYLGNNGYLVISLPGVELELEKIIEGSTENLSGASFYLYYIGTDEDGAETRYYYTYTSSEEDGETVYTAGWTTDADSATVQSTGTDGSYSSISFYGLQPGTYYLVETDAPEGYAKLGSAITATVNTDGSVTMSYNGKDYEVSTVTAPTTWNVGTESRETYTRAESYVSGTVYYTYDYDEDTDAYTYTEAEDVTEENFSSGIYYTQGTVYYYELTVPNTAGTEVDLGINKVGADGSTGLAGAEFYLYYIDYEEAESYTADVTYYAYNENIREYVETEVTEEDFSSGTYYTQVKAYYTADSSGNVSWVSSKNEADKLTSGTDGAIQVYSLTSGRTYYLEEVTAPDGYNLLTDVVAVTVADDGSVSLSYNGATYSENTGAGSGWSVSQNTDEDDGTVTWIITVPNSNGERLPDTGGMGTGRMTLWGMFLLAGGICGLLIRSRRRREEVRRS